MKKMKKHIYKLATLLFATALLLSCNVDNFLPEGVLTEKTLITDEATAQVALNGIYVASRANANGVEGLTIALTLYGAEQKLSLGPSPGLQTFFDNNVKPAAVDRSGGTLFTFYTKSYTLINLSNFFISKVEKGVPGLSKEKTNQMLAEAKTLRANAYFMLLRVFGQFYDINSQYGVVATAQVIDGFTQLKRNTVSETYNLIISDLEFAVKYASNTKEHFYVNKSFSEGLLAKVYLYKGDFPKATIHAKNVIDDLGTDFALEDSYSSIFEQGIQSKEVLYAPYFKKDSGEENVIGFSSNTIKPSDYFAGFANSDPRYTFTFDPNPDNILGTYNKYPSTGSSFYYLRVAEVYLIYAEALIRSEGDAQKTNALAALNKIRDRVGVPAKTYVNKATFLEDVRKEKMIELCVENAESWFDLVRYDRLGDLQANTIKSGITNKNKLIFPIALSTLANNPNFGPQNPGY